MMYFSSILRHSNSPKATIMDTILANIKNLRTEFSDLLEDGNDSNNGIESERNKLDLNSIYSINDLHPYDHDVLARSSTSNSLKATTPPPGFSDENNSFYSNNLGCGLDRYPSHWTSKVFLNHRGSLDSGHNSPEDSRSPSPTYSNIVKSQSPTPLSSDDGIDLGIDNTMIDEENAVLNGATPTSEKEWQLVASKITRSTTKNVISTYCEQRALCAKGHKCQKKHTQKEKELFEARRTAKSANDKEFSDSKFRTELCNKVNVPHNRKMCRFAHGTEQLVCKQCYEVGHGKTNCQKQEKENVSPVRTH